MSESRYTTFGDLRTQTEAHRAAAQPHVFNPAIADWRSDAKAFHASVQKLLTRSGKHVEAITILVMEGWDRGMTARTCARWISTLRGVEWMDGYSPLAGG